MTFRLPNRMREVLEAIAKREDRSTGNVVRRLVERGVEEWLREQAGHGASKARDGSADPAGGH